MIPFKITPIALFYAMILIAAESVTGPIRCEYVASIVHPLHDSLSFAFAAFAGDKLSVDMIGSLQECFPTNINIIQEAGCGSPSPADVIIVSDIYIEKLRCFVLQHKKSNIIFIETEAIVTDDIDIYITQSYYDLSMGPRLLHIRLSPLVAASGEFRIDSVPTCVKDTLTRSLSTGFIYDFQLQCNIMCDGLPVLRIDDLAGTILNSALALLNMTTMPPFVSLFQDINSFLASRRVSNAPLSAPLLYSHLISFPVLLNSLAKHTAATSLLAPTKLIRSTNMTSSDCGASHLSITPSPTLDQLKEQVAYGIRRLVEVAPRLSPQWSIHTIQSDTQTLWMRKYIKSLRDQQYVPIFVCGDRTLSTLNKLALLLLDEDLNNKANEVLVWDAHTMEIATSLGWEDGISLFENSLNITRRLVAGKKELRVVIVALASRIDEKTVVEEIRRQLVEEKWTHSNLSSCSSNRYVLSVLGLMWSDHYIQNNMDGASTSKTHGQQSLVNIALSTHIFPCSEVENVRYSPDSNDGFNMDTTVDNANIDTLVDTPSPPPVDTTDDEEMMASTFRIVNSGSGSHQIPGDPSSRPRTILLTHMFNEEFLLPQWIAHHAPHFDLAILVDYNSSDASLDIIREQAPSGWRVVQSRHAQFSCRDADIELMEIEAEYPHDWKIVLTVAEFLAVKDLRGYLQSAFIKSTGKSPDNSPTFIRFPSYTMIDGDNNNNKNTEAPLLCQRSQYFIDPHQPRHWFGVNLYARFIHKNLPPSIIYGSGRHYLLYRGELLTDTIARKLAQEGEGGEEMRLRWKVANDGPFIAKYKWAPWPESIPRTLQIFPKISDADRLVGTPHSFRSVDDLETQRRRILNTNYISDFSRMALRSDLFADPRRIHHQMWSELCNTPPTLYLSHRMNKSESNDSLVNESIVAINIPGRDGVYMEQIQSDEFYVEVVYYRDNQKVDEKLFVSMRDVWLMRSSVERVANVLQRCRVFCADVLEHIDVESCSETVYAYVYNWVFDLNLSS